MEPRLVSSGSPRSRKSLQVLIRDDRSLLANTDMTRSCRTSLRMISRENAAAPDLPRVFCDIPMQVHSLLIVDIIDMYSLIDVWHPKNGLDLSAKEL